MNTKALVWKEDDMYIIKEIRTGVTTQGKTFDEAMSNIKEAVNLYLEEMPEEKERLERTSKMVALNV